MTDVKSRLEFTPAAVSLARSGQDLRSARRLRAGTFVPCADRSRTRGRRREKAFRFSKLSRRHYKGRHGVDRSRYESKPDCVVTAAATCIGPLSTLMTNAAARKSQTNCRSVVWFVKSTQFSGAGNLRPDLPTTTTRAGASARQNSRITLAPIDLLRPRA